MTKVSAGLAVATVAALLLGSVAFVMLNRSGDKFAECRGTAIAGGATIGGPFTLVDHTGATVTDQQVLAKPALVYFGYTFCPDVCPLDNARNAEAVDILEEQGFEVTPVFITIDPTRDTPEVMADYVANVHPSMVGLTGSQDQVDEAIRTYKAFASKAEGGDPEFYLMNHSTFTYLMLPGTGFADFFKREETAAQIAERTSCFLSAT